jgi:hypothetical protein
VEAVAAVKTATILERAAAVCTEVEVEEMAAYYGALLQAKQTAAEEAQAVAADGIYGRITPPPPTVVEREQLLLEDRALVTTEAPARTRELPMLREPAEGEGVVAARPEVRAEPADTLLAEVEAGVPE